MRKLYLLLITLITIFCILIGTGVIGSGEHLFSGHSSASQTLEKDVTFNAIIIEGKAYDLSIVSGDGHVSYRGSKELMPEVSVDEKGVLTIRQVANARFKARSSAHLTIAVPSDAVMNRVAIDLNAADMTIDSLRCEQLSISANAGDIDLTQCTFGTVMIALNASDIDIAQTTFTDLTITNNAGDIDIEDIQNFDQYRIRCKTDLGDIKIQNRKVGNSYEQDGEGHHIDITNNLGDIKLNQDS